MEPERKSVRVTILNQTYTLAAAGEPGEIEALAHQVDEIMTGIAKRTGNIDSNRIAVLACLHLADQLRSMESEVAALRQRIEQMRLRVEEKTLEFSLLLDQVVDKAAESGG